MNSYVVFENVGRGFVNQDPSSPSGTAQTFVRAPQMRTQEWSTISKHLGWSCSLFVYRKITDFIHFLKIYRPLGLMHLPHHYPAMQATLLLKKYLPLLAEKGSCITLMWAPHQQTLPAWFSWLNSSLSYMAKKTHSLNYMRANTQKLIFAGPMLIKW